jgi:lysophospholipase L1-like esterase
MHRFWRQTLRFAPRALVLVALLAAMACTDSDGDSPTQPTPPANPNEVFYTAVAASDGIGVGSTVPCFPLADCPDGTGYVPLTVRRLRADGKIVTLTNLSLPGYVLSRDIQNIGNSVGRGIDGNFIDRQMPFVPRNSTLITVFAGGNDANSIGEAVARGQAGTDPAAFIATQVNNFGRDMRALYSGIRERAPNARIIVLNLPNMAGLPYAAPLTVAQKRILQSIAVGFSAQTNTLAQQGALVIDLMCDQRSYVPGNYSSDGFHPNDAGYAYLHALIYPVAVGGSAPTPSGSCPAMAQF